LNSFNDYFPSEEDQDVDKCDDGIIGITVNNNFMLGLAQKYDSLLLLIELIDPDLHCTHNQLGAMVRSEVNYRPILKCSVLFTVLFLEWSVLLTVLILSAVSYSVS
jgi:hypothetical protein